MSACSSRSRWLQRTPASQHPSLRSGMRALQAVIRRPPRRPRAPPPSAQGHASQNFGFVWAVNEATALRILMQPHVRPGCPSVVPPPFLTGPTPRVDGLAPVPRARP